MYCYAQLNENGICVGVSRLSGEVNTTNMIQIPTADPDYIWRKFENGQWSVEKFEPETTAPVTEFEETKQRVSDLEMAMAVILGGAE